MQAIADSFSVPNRLVKELQYDKRTKLRERFRNGRLPVSTFGTIAYGSTNCVSTAVFKSTHR
ncbi:Proteasome subunit beta type-5 [Fusarium falciforme]|nr:Proteasome subunit beta type-5 [Fusarium falciforme]